MSKALRRGGRAVFIPTASSSVSPSRPFQAVESLSPPWLSSAGRRALPVDDELTGFSQLDRRVFVPDEAYAPAKRFSGRPARVVSPPPPRRVYAAKKGLPTPLVHNAGGLFFSRPSGVVVCVQRGVRREVMFASGHAGRRGVNRRPGRRGPYSSVRC